MRRLPIFFLLDVSESMVGQPIHLVEEGLRTVIQSLKRDPYALETAHLSVIAFAGKAKTLIPLTEIISYYPPKLPIGGGTSLGIGLNHLMYEIDKHVVRTTSDQKGDWKPLIFLFTDGVPTDNPQSAIERWKEKYKRMANLVAISIGDGTDTSLLHQLTDDVLAFNNSNEEAYRNFFKWITASIRSQSQSVSHGSDALALDRIDDNVVSRVDLEKHPQRVDDNFVVLLGRCANTKLPYLIKYKKTIAPSEVIGFSRRSYNLVGGFKVDNEYFELAAGGAVSNQSINTEELVGAPSCPCCGNQFSFAVCGACSGLFCLGGPGEHSCSWCDTTAFYGFGEGGMDVRRTKG